jgi:hypothetical protein
MAVGQQKAQQSRANAILEQNTLLVSNSDVIYALDLYRPCAMCQLLRILLCTRRQTNLQYEIATQRCWWLLRKQSMPLRTRMILTLISVNSSGATAGRTGNPIVAKSLNNTSLIAASTVSCGVLDMAAVKNASVT